MLNFEFEIDDLPGALQGLLGTHAYLMVFLAFVGCILYFVPLYFFPDDIAWQFFPQVLPIYRVGLAIGLFIFAFALGFRIFVKIGDDGAERTRRDFRASLICAGLFLLVTFGPSPTVGYSGGFPGTGTTVPPVPSGSSSSPGDTAIIPKVIVPKAQVPLPVIVAPPVPSACPDASAKVAPVSGLTAFATACYAEAGCSATATICRRANPDGPDSIACAVAPGFRIDEDTRRNLVNVAAGKGCFADALGWLGGYSNRQQRRDRLITLLGQACPDGWAPPVGDPAFDQLTQIFGGPIRCTELPTNE